MDFPTNLCQKVINGNWKETVLPDKARVQGLYVELGLGAACIDHSRSAEEVRASASNSYTDCYEGPCVSLRPTTL